MANSQGEAFLGYEEMELYRRKGLGLEQIKQEIADFGTESDKVPPESLAPILKKYPQRVFCFNSRVVVMSSRLPS